MNEYVILWAQWGILNYDQYQKVIQHFGNLKNAWQHVTYHFLCQLGFGSEKARRLLEIKNRLDTPTIFKRIEKLNIDIICVDENRYPTPLKSIETPPPFLFVRGKIPPLFKSIGVVGTRKITQYGLMVTEKIVTNLTLNNFVIISGLALGVDAYAHKTCLENKGVTIAVLGSGVDEFYPRTNYLLAQKILENNGAIISEYPIGTKPLKHHFPARNRIISGLSRGVLIAEAGIKSGALITARYALEQGREAFAIPNDITKKELSGTNYLIRKGEAKLIEKVEHILEEFQMEHRSNAPQKIQFSSLESEIIELIINEGMSIDQITQKTPYNVARLSEVLIELQLKGVVREINRKWTLI